ncbi:MAG: DUF1127 domain-containing protein [Pseudomonadota bacterium]
MASISDIPAGRSVRAALAALGSSITDGFVAVGRARARSDELEHYMRMSDEELASQGLTRDGIVRHVFRDMMIL